MTLDEMRLRIPGGTTKVPGKGIMFKTTPSAMQHIVLSEFHLIKDWPNVYIGPSRRNEKNRCECYGKDMSLISACEIQLEKVYRQREGEIW